VAKFLINPITGKLDLSLNKAREIKYDNTTSGLGADNVQDAIDEVVAAVSTPVVEYRTITLAEETAKQLVLANTPLDSNEVIFAVQGGGTQIRASDFSVSGAILSWAGLGLDGILAEDDNILITYNLPI
jgi:hypothetical protein